MIKMIFFIFVLITLLPAAYSAHYIVGKVSPANDTTSPNGRTIVLWNPANGMSDNLTDTVGPSGNSGVSNTYMIDCELLQTPCKVGDKLNLTLIDDGTGHVATSPVQVQVTGAGFNIAPNISMNSPPNVTNISVDDIFQNPADEIDLTPANTTSVTCSAIITDPDGIGQLSEYNSSFYSLNSSFFSDADDNNLHYTNSSCAVNTSYGGPTEASINCTFNVWYYANAESWACTIKAKDVFNTSSNSTDSTKINALLALGANSTVDFGQASANEVTNETVIEVVNYGNVAVNLTLSGYGQTPGDGNSMYCAEGNISVYETKYNLTTSNPGQMTYSQLNQFYKNLTSSPVKEVFNLDFRRDDTINNAKNNTYWRIYMPSGVAGSCTGHIVFGAVQG